MAESDGNAPTRADLPAVDRLRADMQTLEDRIIQVLTRNQAEILEKTQGFIRDREAELLRAFERASVFEDVEGFVTLRNASIDSLPWEV